MKPRLAVLVLLAACSDGSNHPKDAAIDAPPDAPPDAGPCPANRFFTGELVDWDSNETTAFCGIFMATFQVSGDPTRTNATNPNGRFQLCLAAATTTRVDMTPPTAQSECTTPLSTYSMPGIAIADAAVIASGQLFSMRDFTVARQPSLGVTLDGAKGHVFVHVDMTAQPVSITATHDTTQFFDGTAWNTTGPTAANVFFPNVPAGMTTVSMTGGAIGSGDVPVEAGKITYVTLVGN